MPSKKSGQITAQEGQKFKVPEWWSSDVLPWLKRRKSGIKADVISYLVAQLMM